MSDAEDFDRLTETQVLAALEALDNGDISADHPLVKHLEGRILHFSAVAGDAVKAGRDFLPVLTPSAATSAVDSVAMELVMQALEEELEEAGE